MIVDGFSIGQLSKSTGLSKSVLIQRYKKLKRRGIPVTKKSMRFNTPLDFYGKTLKQISIETGVGVTVLSSRHNTYIHTRNLTRWHRKKYGGKSINEWVIVLGVTRSKVLESLDQLGMGHVDCNVELEDLREIVKT